MHRFTSVRFRNYKALRNYSVSLTRFNVLVGPNNSGKSTILGAFRILAEGMRKARARNPEYITLPDGAQHWGYRVGLEDLPVSTENIFTDYDDSAPATVDFRLSNGNELRLVFPAVGSCCLFCRPKSRAVQTTSAFKREYDASVGFVPVLGPVEHDEPLYQKEAARQALLSHRASRNFRNVWYHYPENFERFRDLVRTTWPGMDVEPPKVDYVNGKPKLFMFCPEDRYPREIYWAGFGFQVWCQMLTYMVGAQQDALLVIDEPDIYLHSDLQRQLVSLLDSLGPDILVATHATEIITESEPGDLLVVNKRAGSAQRLRYPSQLQRVFDALGSNLNPMLTQLAKCRRAVFVEGKDFQLLSGFARKLGYAALANRADFAVIPTEGFNAQKVKHLSEGIELTLGVRIAKAVIFDRDYRSAREVSEVLSELATFAELGHIHERKEIENYLLVSKALRRAIVARIDEQNQRTGNSVEFGEDVDVLLRELTAPLLHKVHAQYLAKRAAFERSKARDVDAATINESVMAEFDATWNDPQARLTVVPGKEVFSLVNKYLQERYEVNISVAAVISTMSSGDVAGDLKDLLLHLDNLRLAKVESG
jgi:energy-coupling factor transporter ATP-binding protein EcfA2